MCGRLLQSPRAPRTGPAELKPAQGQAAARPRMAASARPAAASRRTTLIAAKVGNVLVFRPLKNAREHDVPLAASLAPRLARHMELYPPVLVTLPWGNPDGDLVTFRLILTTPAGGALHRTRFNESCWWPAQRKAGITPELKRGQRRKPARDEGMHRGRHTAASAWLGAGVDIVTVAEWLGDTVKVIADTYVHMMPDVDERGRAAMDKFFTRNLSPGSALDVPSMARHDAQ
jgi:integrase